MITIAITRPETSTSSLRRGLEKWGARVEVVPTIARHPLLSPEELHQLQTRLGTYDWVLLTSPFSVRELFKNSSRAPDEKAGEREARQGSSPKWAVVGEATRRALREFGVTVDLMPSQFTARHLAEALGDLEEQRLLIPRSRIGDCRWVNELRRRGALVEDLPLYDTVPRTLSKEEWQTLEAVDTLVFASGSALRSLHGQSVAREDPLPTANQAVFCIGPSTAGVAKDLGVEVSAIASPHTAKGLLRAITEHYSDLRKD